MMNTKDFESHSSFSKDLAQFMQQIHEELTTLVLEARERSKNESLEFIKDLGIFQDKLLNLVYEFCTRHPEVVRHMMQMEKQNEKLAYAKQLYEQMLASYKGLFPAWVQSWQSQGSEEAWKKYWSDWGFAAFSG